MGDTEPNLQNNNWCEDDSDQEMEEYPIDYEIMASPNDFNILTIFNFIESGTVKIPGFQRNYVWDIKRASKLIESLIIGLPVPQVFLYEAGKNNFLVIDGQQRLMSIYYFIKQRFPKLEKRAELRKIFEKHGKIPDDMLHNDEHFAKFNLRLPESSPDKPNRFNGMNYSTLGEYKSTFDLRPIRNVIIKQLLPKDNDSAIYEIFNRLNSGGINLSPQEIRMSISHSDFFDMLSRINTNEEWRKLLGLPDPDLHMKDIEILLRGFSMLIKGNEYAPSMMQFLNGFAKDVQKYDKQTNSYIESLFISFINSCSDLDKELFFGSSNRFSVMVFESIFTIACKKSYSKQQLISGNIDKESIQKLKKDEAFISFITGKTTNTKYVRGRLSRAEDIVRVV